MRNPYGLIRLILYVSVFFPSARRLPAFSRFPQKNLPVHPPHRTFAAPDAEAAGYDKMTTIITIRLKEGREITGTADFGKGSPAQPMTYDEVADKFRDCAAFAGWPPDKTEEVVAMVRHLEDLADLRILTALLAR